MENTIAMKKADVCEMCKKIGGIGITRDTSGNHILCYDCAEKAIALNLITEDCDGLWYDYTDDRLGEYLLNKGKYCSICNFETWACGCGGKCFELSEYQTWILKFGESDYPLKESVLNYFKSEEVTA